MSEELKVYIKYPALRQCKAFEEYRTALAAKEAENQLTHLLIM